jgi:DNA end-binding protein Ku
MAELPKKAKPPKKSIWTGRISLGLVNVPVKIYSMIQDKSFSFRLLHKKDGQPLKYKRVCSKDGEEVDWEDIAKGYEVRKNEFVVFDNEELEAIKPESDERIRIDKFVDYLSVDPIYFDKSYILVPDKSNEAYSLLLRAFQKLGKAGVGRITLRTKEYPALIHEYKGALLLTTLRYPYEVVDPQDLEELKGLPEPGKEELDLAVKIIENLSGEFDITEYKDSYMEKIEELLEKKMKGETVVVEKPKKEEVKELMVALQETIKHLERK